MSEWLAGAKFGMILSTAVGSIISMPFIKLSWKHRAASVASGMTMAYYIGQPVSEWVGLGAEPTGFLIGLFGMSICHLIFDSLKKSDLSVKFSDIIELLRRG